MIITRLLSPGFMHQPSKLKVLCAVHLTRSSPALTISSLLNSYSGLATYWRTCECCVTYLHRLQSGHKNIIEKHGVKMHLYADDTQLYDHLQVNNIERSVAALEACLQDIVHWSSQRRLKLNPSKTELIWFWLDWGHSIEKLSIGPRFGEWSSTPAWLHPGKNVFSISCEEFDRRRKTWTKTLSKH